MEIFISWSGTLSLKIATNLRDWLQDVLPGIEVFVSAEDVDKGAAWFPAIRGHLAKSEVGVVCLTRGNIASNWLHYEAGALARGLERDRICCFLVDVLPTELSSPLREFQATCFTKEDITRLVRTIHQCLDKHIFESDERLRKHVDRFWPDIDRSVREALASGHPKDDAETFDNELLCAVIDRELAAGRIEEVFHWLDRAKVNRSFSCLGTLQFIEGALARIVGHRMASSKLRAAIAHTGGYDFATFELALLHFAKTGSFDEALVPKLDWDSLPKQAIVAWTGLLGLREMRAHKVSAVSDLLRRVHERGIIEDPMEFYMALPLAIIACAAGEPELAERYCDLARREPSGSPGECAQYPLYRMNAKGRERTLIIREDGAKMPADVKATLLQKSYMSARFFRSRPLHREDLVSEWRAAENQRTQMILW